VVADLIHSERAVILPTGKRAVSIEAFRDGCIEAGLLDPMKPDSARTLFRRYRNELADAGLIDRDDDWNWLPESETMTMVSEGA